MDLRLVLVWENEAMVAVVHIALHENDAIPTTTRYHHPSRNVRVSWKFSCPNISWHSPYKDDNTLRWEDDTPWKPVSRRCDPSIKFT